MSKDFFIRFPWPSSIWAPCTQLERQAHRHECYEVVVRVNVRSKSTTAEGGRIRDHDSHHALKTLWSALAAELHPGENGALLDGGAVIRKDREDLLVVVSGGEDALDSISYTVNVTLVEAANSIASTGCGVSIDGGVGVEFEFSVEHEGPGQVR